MPHQWNFWADLGRQQLTVATESACAMFRGFEAMRRIQEEAAQQASERYEAAVERMREPCEPSDLLAIQTDLLRFDVQGATRYWQQLAAAVLEMQTEMLGRATELVDTDVVFGAAPSPVLHA